MTRNEGIIVLHPQSNYKRGTKNASSTSKVKCTCVLQYDTMLISPSNILINATQQINIMINDI